jgi:enterochelin esterase-like enzyme
MIPVRSQATDPYADLTHESSIFGHKKFYRLYLPDGYDTSRRDYPVIYFFHGWGGRHCKDDNALLEYVRIKALTDKYQVILVMWDGNIEEGQPRPYNIGNHKDVVYDIQMKDYFPELVTYIDSTYRTVADRNHRGIIGFSMGGILSFYLAGKYPDMISAAVNLAGTPEFFIGYPGNHTLYPVRYTFKNLMDVQTRQHNGNTDILTFLNEEVRKGAEWEGCPYEYWSFAGGHMVDKPGETTAFEMAVGFIMSSFGRSKSMPSKGWGHYDLYDSFKVWGFDVTSNKQTPGFLFLRNVTAGGFGFHTCRWLPDGPSIPGIKATIITPPDYIPGKSYQVITCEDQNTIHTYTIKVPENGRISLRSEGNTEFGIFSDEDEPEYIALSYRIENHSSYIAVNKPVKLEMKILNRGGEIRTPGKLTVDIHSKDSSVVMLKDAVTLTITPGQRIIEVPAFEISCSKQPPLHGEPFQIKFNVLIKSDREEFSDEITVPVLFEAPAFTNITIDDGIAVKDKAFGYGNGNGVIEAGEHVLLYEGDHRLRLYTDDPWVIRENETLVDEQLKSVWEDSFTLSSVVEISKDCPEGHMIEFIANYETVTYNPIERNLHWGKVRINVKK